MNQGLSAAHRKWVEVIERQRAGGLSVAAFCRKNGIAASSFFVWKRRIISSPVAPVFVEAKVFEPLPAVRGAGVLEIRLRGRRRVRVTDQRGNVRTFHYDLLGRLTNDCVTTLGSDTTNAVLQLARGYEVRGLVQNYTSYDSATPNLGSVLNQVMFDYNAFGQLITEWQEHLSAASALSLKVQYAWSNGATSLNTLRPLSVTYPDGRVIGYDYGPAGGMNDRLSRVGSITSEGAEIAAYTYLGSGTVVRIDYPEPAVRLDLWGGASGTFAGIDRFGRVVDQRWQNNVTGAPADIDRYQYGYDQNSNRQYKANVVGTAVVTAGLDEYYVYDPLNRLTQMQRGVLNSSVPPTGITGTPSVEQDWTLDPVGNWDGFATAASGTTTLDQSRTQNPVNEITAVTESTGPTWVTPAYDAAGNTTTFPLAYDPASAAIGTYDAWNRLCVVRVSDTQTVGYGYDARNRRITNTGFGALLHHRYYTNRWQCVEERTSTSFGLVDAQYVWGLRYVDELVCRDVPSTGADQRLYACQDANFNVTALADVSGSVVQRFVYDPYGSDQVLAPDWSSTTDAYGWLYRFQGGRRDVGWLYHFRNRDYTAILGTWLERDPLQYADGVNTYSFDHLNPNGYTDPSGTLVYFSIYYNYKTDKNKAFQRAALTWQRDIYASPDFDPNCDIVIPAIGVATKEEFKRAWRYVQLMQQRLERDPQSCCDNRFAHGAVFTHSSTGNIPGLNFHAGPVPGDDGILHLREIERLPRLHWVPSGMGCLELKGCEAMNPFGGIPTALFVEIGGDTIAKHFLDSQYCCVLGNKGKGSFSSDPNKYKRIDDNTFNVYLGEFDKGWRGQPVVPPIFWVP